MIYLAYEDPRSSFSFQMRQIFFSEYITDLPNFSPAASAAVSGFRYQPELSFEQMLNIVHNVIRFRFCAPVLAALALRFGKSWQTLIRAV